MSKTSTGSGIYIFEDGKPVRIEDCSPETRRAWMEPKQKKYLMALIDRLCEAIAESNHSATSRKSNNCATHKTLTHETRN